MSDYNDDPLLKRLKESWDSLQKEEVTADPIEVIPDEDGELYSDFSAEETGSEYEAPEPDEPPSYSSGGSPGSPGYNVTFHEAEWDVRFEITDPRAFKDMVEAEGMEIAFTDSLGDENIAYALEAEGEDHNQNDNELYDEIDVTFDKIGDNKFKAHIKIMYTRDGDEPEPEPDYDDEYDRRGGRFF